MIVKKILKVTMNFENPLGVSNMSRLGISFYIAWHIEIKYSPLYRSSDIGAKIQYKCGISSIKYPNVSNFSTCEFTILLKLIYIFIYSYYST